MSHNLERALAMWSTGDSGVVGGLEGSVRMVDLAEEIYGLLACRESLDRCLKAMAYFDHVDYDDYGGPHLSEGIDKLGSSRIALAFNTLNRQGPIQTVWDETLAESNEDNMDMFVMVGGLTAALAIEDEIYRS